MLYVLSQAGYILENKKYNMETIRSNKNQSKDVGSFNGNNSQYKFRAEMTRIRYEINGFYQKGGLYSFEVAECSLRCIFRTE